MKRALGYLAKAAISPAVPPCLVGIFLLIYVVVAFGSNEALTTLMGLTRDSLLLIVLLALIPLNRGARLWVESAAYLKRRKALAGRSDSDLRGLFDEAVELPEGAAFHDQEPRLASLGYKTRRTDSSLSAWRGITSFPARLLFLLGTLCLFAGILLSLTGRVSHREPVVEGEPLAGTGDVVERITLKEERGLFLARSLEIVAATEGGGRRSFGLYPPSSYRGTFLYPRYMGIAPQLRFWAPEFPQPFESYLILMIYPPGKEDSAQIPGTPYRIFFKMASVPGPDPYVSGRPTLEFRVLKGESQVLAGSTPIGGEVAGNGYRVALPTSSRVVAVDFVRDPGVVLIWAAGILILAALVWWLPVRLWVPRREMLFIRDSDGILALSRAEGGRRSHAGSYHEVLDLLENREW